MERGEMMKQIKPLRTFAAGQTVYLINAVDPYEVTDEQAANWEASGHCKIVGEEKEEVEPEALEAAEAETVTATEPEQEPDEFKLLSNEDLKEKYTVGQLKDIAKERKLKGYSNKNQDQLITLIKGE